MGKKTDKVLEAVRIVRNSLSHIGEIASDQLSRRSTGTEPWTTVRDSLERILARSRQPSSPPIKTSDDQVAPLVQEPSDKAEDTDATTATASRVGVPDAAQAAHEPQHISLTPEPEPLSSNPKISMLSLSTRHCLMHSGIDTLEDLRDKEAKDLLALPGFGAKALEEVDRFLSAQHLPPISTAPAAESESPPESEASRLDARSFICAPLESNPYFYMLSKRTYRLISSAGISSLADLRRTDRASLLALKGFGVTCSAEVDRFLEANGLPNTEFGSSVASMGRFDEKPFRFDALSERTRTLLRKIGISTEDQAACGCA